MIKNLYNLRNEKTQYFFILDYRGIREEVRDLKGLNKWNQGKIN